MKSKGNRRRLKEKDVYLWKYCMVRDGKAAKTTIKDILGRRDSRQQNGDGHENIKGYFGNTPV